MSIERRRERIEPDHPDLFIGQQCRLLSLSRSAFYYVPVGENPFDLALMRLIDAAFLECPFYGARQTPSPGHAQETVSIIPMAA
jgi:putative transposase